MAPRQRVYLAGPISNCNLEQRHAWREEIKGHWGHQYEFIDPTAFVLVDDATPWEVVHADLDAIRRADAVLANMWKESIGTAIGIAHAALNGTPVYVADVNRLVSRTVAYYARGVVRTPDEAMRRIREEFRQRSALVRVIKQGGREEPFDREKLLKSIRSACANARADDLLAPAEILPRAISRLLERKPHPVKGGVTSTAIREAVWETLRDLEADALRGVRFAGIREAWEQFDRGRRLRPAEAPDPETVRLHPRPLSVRVASNKSHSSIWGPAIKDVGQIPRDARRLFQEVCRVDGIKHVRLTKKAHSRSLRGGGVKAEILASREPLVIEGKCYDQGERGDVQMFQILVHDAGAKEAIRLRLMEHLRSLNLLLVSSGESGSWEGPDR